MLLSTNKPEIASSDEISLKEIYHENLLGVKIDSELKFENPIAELYLKVIKKLNLLCSIDLPYCLIVPGL